MKIVRPICCGLDVHKNLIVATIGTTDVKQRITTYEVEEFSTLTPDLYRLKGWLISRNCFSVCMESTGKYWIPVFNILESDMEVCLTHPKYVKAIKGKKTDKKDSKWICDLFKHDLVPCSFIPPQPIRALREIARYRTKLVYMRSSEKNRYQNSMTASNIGIGSIFSDPFGKTASSIMKLVLSSDSISDKDILKLTHKSCKNKDKILASIKDHNITSDQNFKMTQSFNHISQLDAHVDACERELVLRSLDYQNELTLICSVPGITPLSAILILAEIGADMSQFKSSKQFISWLGLCPANNESANKKKSVRISKAGQYIKPLLVQIALANIKMKGSYFQIKYERIKKRRGHKKAILAIARMIMVNIYFILQTGELFNPCDIDTIINPSKQLKQPTTLTVDSAIAFLQNQGFNIQHPNIE